MIYSASFNDGLNRLRERARRVFEKACAAIVDLHRGEAPAQGWRPEGRISKAMKYELPDGHRIVLQRDQERSALVGLIVGDHDTVEQFIKRIAKAGGVAESVRDIHVTSERLEQYREHSRKSLSFAPSRRGVSERAMAASVFEDASSPVAMVASSASVPMQASSSESSLDAAPVTNPINAPLPSLAEAKENSEPRTAQSGSGNGRTLMKEKSLGHRDARRSPMVNRSSGSKRKGRRGSPAARTRQTPKSTRSSTAKRSSTRAPRVIRSSHAKRGATATRSKTRRLVARPTRGSVTRALIGTKSSLSRRSAFSDRPYKTEAIATLEKRVRRTSDRSELRQVARELKYRKSARAETLAAQIRQRLKASP